MGHTKIELALVLIAMARKSALAMRGHWDKGSAALDKTVNRNSKSIEIH